MSALPVKQSDIKMEVLRKDTTTLSDHEMLPGEIPGAAVIDHTLPKGTVLQYAGQRQCIRIFFLCEGAASFAAAGKTFSYAEKAMFVAKPESDVTITAAENANLLEIRWDMNEQDLADLDASKEDFPLSQAYADAPQYRDFFKSETTISRAILKQTVIPRFAMGSVEAKADDLVGQHAHPLLDQFFFSFPENDMDLLIDCRICPMKGNTLLHIPLGSNHGVIALGSQRMHYLWIDCTPQDLKDQAVAYLNDVHKETGVKQVLDQ